MDLPADERRKRREESLPFSPREPEDVTEMDTKRRIVRVRHVKKWIKGTMEFVPDIVRMLRKILADGSTLF